MALTEEDVREILRLIDEAEEEELEREERGGDDGLSGQGAVR